MTLDNAEQIKKEISEYPTEIKIASFLADRKPSFSPEIPAEEARNIMNAAYKEVNESLTKSYADSVASTKQDLLDTFDSKVSELQEQKRLEDERRKAEEEAKKAADEKAKAEAEARAKAAEEERKKREEELKAAEAQAEKERLEKAEAERKQREEEERIRKAQSQTQTLFDQAPAVAAPVKAKVSHHIEIDDPTGFLAIIQMWWTHEGSKMSLEDLNKKLGFMVKTCEKVKNKEDITVIDPAVRYVEDIVAK